MSYSSFCDNPDYYIPKVANVESYKDYLNSLDINDDPAVFGMHKNANMSYQAQETEKLLKTVMEITAGVVKGGGVGGDEAVLKYCETLLAPEEGVPNPIKTLDIRDELLIEDSRKLKPSLTVVLFQEIDRFNNLINIIQDSLEKLVAAIQGTIIMSAALDDVYMSLLNNQVPKMWSNNAYPSLKPLYSWVKDLRARVEFMQTWVTQGEPKRFALPYFFFPQGFLTGVLQTFARKNTIAIDKLRFEFRVIDPEKEATEERLDHGEVYITGLFLDGARWDKKRKSLQDQTEGVMYDEMLPIVFTPTENRELTLREQRKVPKQVEKYR